MFSNPTPDQQILGVSSFSEKNNESLVMKLDSQEPISNTQKGINAMIIFSLPFL